MGFAEAQSTARERRPWCFSCCRPRSACYCNVIRPFASSPRFVILMHPEEAKRPVATGRMAHRCLSNSRLFVAGDFSRHEAVDALLSDPALHPMILYPAQTAVNLTTLPAAERTRLAPAGKELLLFVLDGTWRTAKRLRRLSPALQSLPALSLTPRRPSGFTVRRQPRAECLATIEAIHEVIDLMGESASPSDRRHDTLLDVFHWMVRSQEQHKEERRPAPRPCV